MLIGIVHLSRDVFFHLHYLLATDLQPEGVALEPDVSYGSHKFFSLDSLIENTHGFVHVFITDANRLI